MASHPADSGLCNCGNCWQCGFAEDKDEPDDE